jgi:hypothetical protein
MAADIGIFEEGRRQAISHLASGDAPIDVGFLLDTSRMTIRRQPIAISLVDTASQVILAKVVMAAGTARKLDRISDLFLAI